MTTYELNIKELDRLIYFIARFLHDKNPDFNHPFRMSVDEDVYLQIVARKPRCFSTGMNCNFI